MWRKNAATIAVGFVLGAFLVVYMSTYQVRFHEVALVKTFGRVTHVEADPGLRWRWPWPVQQVVTYDRRVNILEDPISEPLTLGGKPITAQGWAAWRIRDPELFLKKISSVSRATAHLRNLLKQYKEDVLSQYSLDNFVSTDPSRLKLAEVEDRVFKALSAAGGDYGIEVMAVGIKRLGAPGSTSEQIFAAMKGGRQVLVQQYQSQGNAKATQIASDATKIRDKILSFAQLRAEQLRAEGQAAAASRYETFRGHEDFAVFLAELGMLRQTLASNTTIVLDWTTRPFNFFSVGPSLPAQGAAGGPLVTQAPATPLDPAATQPAAQTR